MQDVNMSGAYRDSKDWYLKEGGKIPPSPRLIALCRERAGRKVLDLGCAVGNYCAALNGIGFQCSGVDVNEEYVAAARAKGIDAHVAKGPLPFADKSFDTVVIFEVLEHLREPDTVLTEAKRVARKNVLITVPDNTEFEKLRKLLLTYEHMLERDHVNFFSKESLAALLGRHFSRVTVWEEEPVFVHHALPWFARKPLTLLAMAGMVKPTFYNRLYAECTV